MRRLLSELLERCEKEEEWRGSGCKRCGKGGVGEEGGYLGGDGGGDCTSICLGFGFFEVLFVELEPHVEDVLFELLFFGVGLRWRSVVLWDECKWKELRKSERGETYGLLPRLKGANEDNDVREV